MRLRSLACLSLILAGCTATATGSVTPGSSAAPTTGPSAAVSARPAAQASLPPGYVAYSVESLDLMRDGTALAVPKEGMRNALPYSISFQAGMVGVTANRKDPYVSATLTFRKPITDAALTEADLSSATFNLNNPQPDAVGVMTSLNGKASNDVLTVKVAEGRFTLTLDGTLAAPVGGTSYRVKGTIVGRLR